MSRLVVSCLNGNDVRSGHWRVDNIIHTIVTAVPHPVHCCAWLVESWWFTCSAISGQWWDAISHPDNILDWHRQWILTVSSTVTLTTALGVELNLKFHFRM